MTPKQQSTYTRMAEKAGFSSLAAAGLLSPAQLRQRAQGTLSDYDCVKLHAAAVKARNDALILEKNILTHASPLLPQAIRQGLRRPDVSLLDYEDWFGGRAGRYANPGDVASMFSPAAYLTELYREARPLYPESSLWHIDARRPDLKALVLNQDNLDREVGALSLSSDILMSHVKAELSSLENEEQASAADASDEDVLQALAGHLLGAGTPYHHHHTRLRQVRQCQDPDFKQLQAAPSVTKHLSGASLAGIYYDIPPALYDLLTDIIPEDNAGAMDKFRQYFGEEITPETLLDPRVLRGWYGLADEELRTFIGDLQPFLSDKLGNWEGNVLVTRTTDEDGKETLWWLSYTKERFQGFLNYARLTPKGGTDYTLSISVNNTNAGLNRFRVFVNEAIVFDGGEDNHYLEPNTNYDFEIQIPENIGSQFLLKPYRHGADQGMGLDCRYTVLTCNPEVFALKLNKAIRLYKATGLPARVLEDVVNSVNPDQITDETLTLLFRTALLMKQYNIGHEDALAMTRGLISRNAPEGELSQWDRVFNSPSLVEGGLEPSNTKLYLHPDRAEEHAEIKAALKRAFQTDDMGLYYLKLAYHAEQDSAELGLNEAHISGMYTLSLWARLHGLTPFELRHLLQMIGPPSALYNAPPGTWLSLLERLQTTTQWMKAAGFSVQDLVLMTRPVTGIALSADVANFLRQLQAVAKTVEANAESKPAQTDVNDQDGPDELVLRTWTPLVAAAFGLNHETTARAVLTWADGRADELSIGDAWAALQSAEDDATPSDELVAFAYGLAQMALICHASGVAPDVLTCFVAHPEKLYVPAALPGETFLPPPAQLQCSLGVILALSAFSGWLRTLPDTTVASGALTDALAGQGVTAELLASITGLGALLLNQAMAAAKAKGDIESDARLASWPEIQVLRQWCALAQAFNVTPANIAQMLELEYTQDTPAGWADWKRVADAFVAGLTISQQQIVLAQTAPRLSAALSGYLLTPGKPLAGFMSREQVSGYLLADNQNGAQVKTSRLAEAIAALQTFIHRNLAQPESGNINRAVLTGQFFREWTQWNARYSNWVAKQKLMYYPENYIDPTVRLGQTRMMDDMLQTLGQAQINTDTVGDAFMGYLTSFEEVANLETVHGYHDNVIASTGKTWFIGRNQAETPEYWWRTADEDKRSREGTLPANAWTGWEKIDAAIHPWNNLIRPVVYKSRLYLLWVEHQSVVTVRDNNGAPTKWEERWELKVSWRRYDGNWSAPVTRDMTALFKVNQEQKLDGMYVSVWNEHATMLVIFYKPGSAADDINGIESAGLKLFDDMSFESIHRNTTSSMVEVLGDAGQLETSTTSRTVIIPYSPPGLNAEGSIRVESSMPEWFDRFELTFSPPAVLVYDSHAAKYNISIEVAAAARLFHSPPPNSYLEILKSTFPSLARESGILRCLSAEGVLLIRRDDCRQAWVIIKNSLISYVWPGLFSTVWVGDRGLTGGLNGTPVWLIIGGELHVLASVWGDYDLSFENVVVGVANVSGGVLGQAFLNNLGVVEGSVDLRDSPFIPSGNIKVWLDNISHPASDDWHYVNSPNWSETFTLTRENVPIAEWAGGKEHHHLLVLDIDGDVRRYTLKVWLTANTPPQVSIHGDTRSAQYLDYDGDITRLNTLFARQLTEKAASGIDAILNYETQQLSEPPIPNLQLTLPPYDSTEHGNDRRVEIYQAVRRNDSTDDPATNISLGVFQLSDSAPTIVHVLFDRTKPFEGQNRCHVVARYANNAQSAVAGNSIVIDKDTLAIVRGELPELVTQSEIISNATPGNVMDFAGANAIYFWELFYYTPMMVMQRFLQEERFDQAEQWLKYIFSPAGYIVYGEHENRLWNVRPLQEDTSWNDAPLESYDPDAVAQNDPMHYKLNAFMRLLDIIIGRGDSAYRKLERDTLAEAKVWYGRALSLLGEAPWIAPNGGWGAPSLGEAAAESVQMARLDALSALLDGTQRLAEEPERVANHLFSPEANTLMLGYWETLRLRLYNLRNNLTIDGQSLSLPLYATPADPKALLSAAVAAATGANSGLPTINLSVLRFMPLLESARMMAGQLIQFGSTMQQILERQDAEALQELLNTQGVEMATSGLALQKHTLEELAAERETLTKSLATATQRRDHYRKLYEENINSREEQALTAITGGAQLALGAKISFATGAAIAAVPNIFGLANGGHRPDQIANAVGFGLQLAGDMAIANGNRVNQEEQYRRRRQEWDIQRAMAQGEMSTIEAQLETLAVRATSVRMQIAHGEMQQAQAKAQLVLLQSKYSGKAMYSWLRSQLASIFYQYYDLTASRCLMAQESLRWELNDPSINHLRTGTWSGAWAGLMSGEGLMLNLAQMENTWLKYQKRELEITRTVSLAEFLKDRLETDGESSRPLTLNEAIQYLLDTPAAEEIGGPDGKIELNGNKLAIHFDLVKLGIESDYETGTTGQRRVRSIAVTLPALLGPYQDIRATLFTTNADLPPGCNELAVSHAMADSGQFSPDVSDGRWLPFEGLSLQSDSTPTIPMTLSFEAVGPELKQGALLRSLTDAVLHVRYTLRK
ncbi:neuraminidase-like domain-containing protein [Pseudomonas sp. Q1]|uniref:Tc toxin subunit A-related protein n=1 Tax=Pseudomonas sp. Q1 TaxID=2202823 RepID=UPI0013750257|nr:neuraminidase-like domain-containing protein [Pseudomonas sp. Q1]